jgi:hypothetical protein
MDGIPKRIANKLVAYGLETPEDVSRAASWNMPYMNKAAYLAFLGPKSRRIVDDWLRSKCLPCVPPDDTLERVIRLLEGGKTILRADRKWLLDFLKGHARNL